MRLTSAYIFWYCLIAVCLATTVGCKQPEPNPELRDPIYLDLKTRAGALERKVTEERAKVRSAWDELEKLEPRDKFRNRKTRDYYASERALLQLEQNHKYFEVRTQQRLEYARREYLKAFHSGKDWPDPTEFAEYKARESLRNAPKSWESRVPKSTRYNRKPPHPPSSDSKTKE